MKGRLQHVVSIQDAEGTAALDKMWNRNPQKVVTYMSEWDYGDGFMCITDEPRPRDEELSFPCDIAENEHYLVAKSGNGLIYSCYRKLD